MLTALLPTTNTNYRVRYQLNFSFSPLLGFQFRRIWQFWQSVGDLVCLSNYPIINYSITNPHPCLCASVVGVCQKLVMVSKSAGHRAADASNHLCISELPGHHLEQAFFACLVGWLTLSLCFCQRVGIARRQSSMKFIADSAGEKNCWCKEPLVQRTAIHSRVISVKERPFRSVKSGIPIRRFSAVNTDECRFMETVERRRPRLR